MEYLTCILSDRENTGDVQQEEVIGWYFSAFQLPKKVEALWDLFTNTRYVHFPFEVFRNNKAQQLPGRYNLNIFTIDNNWLENVVVRGKTYTKLLAVGFLQLEPMRRRKPVVSPYIPPLGILSGGITNSRQLPRCNFPVHFLVVIINCLANWTPIQQRQT